MQNLPLSVMVSLSLGSLTSEEGLVTLGCNVSNGFRLNGAPGCCDAMGLDGVEVQ